MNRPFRVPPDPVPQGVLVYPREGAPVPAWQPEMPAAIPGLVDPQWLDLEQVLPFRICRRLPWFETWCPGRTRASDLGALPRPWPELPPGWTLMRRAPMPQRSWARVVLGVEAPWWLTGQVHWLLDLQGHPGLVALGEATPTLRLRLQLLSRLLVLRGNPAPRIWIQPWPKTGPVELWTAAWPPVRPMPLPPFPVELLGGLVGTLRADLLHPLPPPRSAPVGRCWDCPAFLRCGEVPR